MTYDSPDYSRPLQSIPLAAGALKACAECPWRASNLGKLDANRDDATFSRESLTEHWKRLTTEGATCRCHMTTPGYYHHDESLNERGWKEPRMFKGDGHRQCAGQLAMVRREVEKMLTYPDHAAYIRENPTGLQKRQAGRFLRLLLDPESAPVPFRWPAEDVDDVLDPADLVDLNGWEWSVGRDLSVNMRNLIEIMNPQLAACDCKFCARHHTIHATKPVTLKDGTTVDIDAGVAPVVAAFAAADVNTSESCEDFGPALRELDLNAYLLLRDNPAGDVNHSRTIREGGAFVRFSSATPAGERIAARLRERYSLDSGGIVNQVTFPLSEAGNVERIVRAAARA
ncbi:hypothetical protein M3D62_010655 [Micrococcus luteus]|nr:hypothetical protein [Micrococcus luteus]